MDITLIINIQGFQFLKEDQHIFVPREISWVHLNYEIGETISVFTPDYQMSDSDRDEVYEKTKKVHGLGFKSFPDDEGLSIRNDEVVDYLQQLHRLYGGKFAFKGGIIDVSTFNKWGIPTVFLTDIPKCVRVKGPGCSMYRCMYYKNLLK